MCANSDRSFAASHCGHDPAQFVTGDEGTSYCPACERDAASSDFEPIVRQPRWREAQMEKRIAERRLMLDVRDLLRLPGLEMSASDRDALVRIVRHIRASVTEYSAAHAVMMEEVGVVVDAMWLPEQHDQHCPAREGGSCTREDGCYRPPIRPPMPKPPAPDRDAACGDYPATLQEVASEISDLLDRIGNAPHEDFEGNGGLCPLCGLVTKLMATLREELDALALREHVAAHPTPPSGRTVEKVETVGELSPPRTTMFRKPDGSPLIEITFTHTFSKLTGLRRRRDG